jgi:DNA-directed RNA polymerase sigma subunit (sigma70/sigma32)
MNASKRYALTPREEKVMQMLREHTLEEVATDFEVPVSDIETIRKTALRKRRWFRSSVAPGKI